jgi:hypothetical protein
MRSSFNWPLTMSYPNTGFPSVQRITSPSMPLIRHTVLQAYAEHETQVEGAL